MRVEQAVFTSIRSGRNEGYQLAACSAGITTEQQRELAQWGPGHDSLYSDLPNAESVNFHQMADGMYCVSRSVLAGREYSGRGGQRVFTHIFLLPAEGLERFGNSPFRIIDSLVVGGRCGVEQVECGDLEPFELVGRASLVNVANLEQVVRILGPERLASLVQAALVGERIAVAAPVSGRRLFYALLDLLPPHYRPDYSLTTGLKLAATRNYRLSALPAETAEHRRAVRQLQMEVLDLNHDPPDRFAPRSGWPSLVQQLLSAGAFQLTSEFIANSRQRPNDDLHLLAEEYRAQLDNVIERAAIERVVI